ncbi:MAG TPA: chemotaxis protein CheW [Mycobacteriales bacterium]|nr:chemotaxis protein CheW [Mycobacteriales bacterium]
MRGYVTFRLGERCFATPLDEVREVVRLRELEALPGMQAPLAGVIVLRGVPLPVLDVRPEGAGRAGGDVIVLERAGGEAVGVAVDAVLAVRGEHEFAEARSAAPANLPSYVVEVLQDATGPVLLVNLERLLELTAAA